MSTLDLLGDLDLLGEQRNRGKRLSQSDIRELRDGERRFDWMHLGATNLTLRAFHSVMRKHRLSPPRSGHVGNWEPTIQGWGGMLDYNSAAAFQSTYGSPLLVDWTRTETEDLRDGDTIYRPASRITRLGLAPLPLYAWDGSRFSPVDRTVSRFVPFVLTKTATGTLQSLIHYHHLQNEADGWHFSYLSQQVVANERRVRAALTSALTQILHSDAPGRNLAVLLDRHARPDGAIVRETPNISTASIHMGGISYSSVDHLIDACMVPFHAAAREGWWAANAARQAPTIPLLSNIVVILAMYPLLRTHETADAETNGPLLVHPHWGAAGMAGFPPGSRGYFAKQVTELRICVNLLLASQSGEAPISSILYLLAPAAIFLLTPMSNQTNDARLLDDLLGMVSRHVEGLGYSEVHQQMVDAVVLPWLRENERHLSAYWCGRFRAGGGIGSVGAGRADAHPVVSDTFLDMPMRTLCMVLGAINQYFGKNL